MISDLNNNLIKNFDKNKIKCIIPNEFLLNDFYFIIPIEINNLIVDEITHVEINCQSKDTFSRNFSNILVSSNTNNFKTLARSNLNTIISKDQADVISRYRTRNIEANTSNIKKIAFNKNLKERYDILLNVDNENNEDQYYVVLDSSYSQYIKNERLNNIRLSFFKEGNLIDYTENFLQVNFSQIFANQKIISAEEFYRSRINNALTPSGISVEGSSIVVNNNFINSIDESIYESLERISSGNCILEVKLKYADENNNEILRTADVNLPDSNSFRLITKRIFTGNLNIPAVQINSTDVRDNNKYFIYRMFIDLFDLNISTIAVEYNFFNIANDDRVNIFNQAFTYNIDISNTFFNSLKENRTFITRLLKFIKATIFPIERTLGPPGLVNRDRDHQSFKVIPTRDFNSNLIQCRLNFSSNQNSFEANINKILKIIKIKKISIPTTRYRPTIDTDKIITDIYFDKQLTNQNKINFLSKSLFELGNENNFLFWFDLRFNERVNSINSVIKSVVRIDFEMQIGGRSFDSFFKISANEITGITSEFISDPLKINSLNQKFSNNLEFINYTFQNGFENILLTKIEDFDSLASFYNYKFGENETTDTQEFLKNCIVRIEFENQREDAPNFKDYSLVDFFNFDDVQNNILSIKSSILTILNDDFFKETSSLNITFRIIPLPFELKRAIGQLFNMNSDGDIIISFDDTFSDSEENNINRAIQLFFLRATFNRVSQSQINGVIASVLDSDNSPLDFKFESYANLFFNYSNMIDDNVVFSKTFNV